MTTKFEELLRYLLTELLTPKIGAGPIFGTFSENRPRANFEMGLFSVSTGIRFWFEIHGIVFSKFFILTVKCRACFPGELGGSFLDILVSSVYECLHSEQL